MRVLLHPPTKWGGSLGDQALIRGALSVLGPSDVYVPDDYVVTWQDVSPLARLVTAPDAKQYDMVAIIGADCIDGAYEDQVCDPEWPVWLRQIGRKVRVVSFSLSERSSDESIATLRTWKRCGVRFYARDSISRARALNRIGAGVQQAGDLAFLAGAVNAPESVQAFAAAALVSGGTPVTVCATARGVEGSGADATAAAILQVPSPHVIAVSHDVRDGSDVPAAEAVLSLLPESVPRMVVQPSSCKEARGVVRESALAISHRLHCAIACLAEGVPAVALNYVGKMVGIYRDLGVSDLVAESPGALPDVTAKAVAHASEYRRKVRLGVPKMQDLARVNFAGVAA